MSQKIPVPPQAKATAEVPGRPSIPPPRTPMTPVEPVEVLGRHKNTGQKDHKGAR
jgi:hypothetical protein